MAKKKTTEVKATMVRLPSTDKAETPITEEPKIAERVKPLSPLTFRLAAIAGGDAFKIVLQQLAARYAVAFPSIARAKLIDAAVTQCQATYESIKDKPNALMLMASTAQAAMRQVYSEQRHKRRIENIKGK